MAKRTIILETPVEKDFSLIAIYSNEEPYRLGYLLNKHLCIGLEREPIGLTVLHQDYTLFYPFFEFYDNEKQRYFHLVKNHSSINQTANLTNGLFAGDFLNKEKIVCLIPEHKNVDYFLKIRCENANFSEKKLLLTLKNISQIVLAYPVNTKELKSINNLIFE